MFGDVLAPTHLLLIMVVALLVLGPKRLPEVGRSLGKGLRDFREAMSSYSPEGLLSADDPPRPAPAPPVATASAATAAPVPANATAVAEPEFDADPEPQVHDATEPATAGVTDDAHEPETADASEIFSPPTTVAATQAPEPADAEVVPTESGATTPAG
jgi:sec-independent protein translocase protein TatA